MIINNFIVPLLLTIIIECIVAFLLGYRRKKLFICVILVNFITNPFLNYIIILISYLGLIKLYLFFVIPLEIAVVFVEWGILQYTLGLGRKKMFLLSFLMNLTSYAIGLLIY